MRYRIASAICFQLTQSRFVVRIVVHNFLSLSLSLFRCLFHIFGGGAIFLTSMSQHRNHHNARSRHQDGHECQPIHTIKDLLEFEHNPVSWRNLVLPITPRSRSRYLGEQYQEINFDAGVTDFVEDQSRPQVLLCHDFKGNYLIDRFINGTIGQEWVDYRFYNWSAVDIFCYFSHNFVTIPTLQWLNCAHKNGVKVIGTFIVEGGNVTLLKDILQSEEFMRKVADALVTVAKICQFQVKSVSACVVT